MVQSHAHNQLGIQASHEEPEKPSCSQPHHVSRNMGAGAGLKKMEKPSSKPSQRSDVPLPGKPLPPAAQPGEARTSLQHRQCLPTTGAPRTTSLKQSPIKTSTSGSPPNYMKPTSSSNSKKEMPQVSTTTSSSVKKPGRTLSALTETPGFKSFGRTKSSSKKCPQVAFPAQFKVQQPTCSSTLKDSQFPVYLLLAPGGTESEGTSVPNVCPYAYCSLNGNHCIPPPPFRCFMAGRTPSLKTRRSAKSGAPSIRTVEKPAFQEDDFGIEIYATEMKEEKGTGLPHRDMANTNIGTKEGVPVEDRQMKAVCGSDTGSEAIDMNWEEGQFSLQFDNHEVHESVHSVDETYNKNGYSSELETSNSGLHSFENIQVEIFGHGECFEEEGDEANKNRQEYSTEAFAATIETLAMKPLLSSRANSFLDLPDEALKMEAEQHENQALTDTVCSNDETNLESGCSFYIFNSGEEPIFVSDNDTVCQNRNIDEYIGTMVRSTEVSEAKIETHSIKPLLSNDANSLSDLADEALMEAGQYEKQKHVDEALLVGADQHESQNLVEEAPVEVDETLIKAEQHENQSLEDEALMEFDQHGNQTLIDEVWETNVECLPLKPLLLDGLTDGAPIDDSCHENETLHAACPLLGKQSSSDHKKINEDENQEVHEESMHPCMQEMDCFCKDAVSSSMKTAVFKTGRDSKQELADTCKKLKLRKGCPRADINEEELTKFNPRQPNFLPAEADLEAEKVDLRHQVMDERKSTEDWMLDNAIQQAINKLSPARNKKVALLVEAFETVLPIPNRETHQRHPPPTAFPHSRHIQACS